MGGGGRLLALYLSWVYRQLDCHQGLLEKTTLQLRGMAFYSVLLLTTPPPSYCPPVLLFSGLYPVPRRGKRLGGGSKKKAGCLAPKESPAFHHTAEHGPGHPLQSLFRILLFFKGGMN